MDLQHMEIGAGSVEPLMFPPSGIKPQVGELVQLRLRGHNMPAYYSVRLIGYDRNRTILVTTPMSGGVPVTLAEGEPLEVRMVTGNNIYAFDTFIQRLCISPLHYLHLDYPAEVRAQLLRKSPWAGVNIQAEATAAAGVRAAVRIVNLSPDGALLQAPSALGKQGDALRLVFRAEMEELGTILSLAATIQHMRPLQGVEGGAREIGIAFSEVPPADALWLKGVVYRHIAEGDMA